MGDEILQRVARILSTSSRNFDMTARYGGEEFVVVLPDCPVTGAIDLAERLRQLITKMNAIVPITVSAGVATFPAHANDSEELVKAADWALYEAKRTGRNRVCVAPRSLKTTPPGAPSDEQSQTEEYSEVFPDAV
jgi:diguanylate cyclase (GGDEF)-like protein